MVQCTAIASMPNKSKRAGDWKVEKSYPAIAQWVRGYGHIEIGDQDGYGFIARALDYGGLVFEDDTPRSLAEAMAALETALTRWFQDEGIEIET